MGVEFRFVRGGGEGIGCWGMNWLAHLYFAEPTPEDRLGNLLPDLLGGADLARVPAIYERGIRRHRQIDAFTDAHPMFRQSVGRIPMPLRRYGGILVDVFYDHFLARQWDRYAAVSLERFAVGAYEDLAVAEGCLGGGLGTRLDWMRKVDLLCSYREVEGVERALRGISRRLRRPVDLGAAVGILEAGRAGFGGDFAEFFPALQAAAAGGFEAASHLPPGRQETIPLRWKNPSSPTNPTAG
jgi:acyl carrier protein phosphodiesterase